MKFESRSIPETLNKIDELSLYLTWWTQSKYPVKYKTNILDRNRLWIHWPINGHEICFVGAYLEYTDFNTCRRIRPILKMGDVWL